MLLRSSVGCSLGYSCQRYSGNRQLRGGLQTPTNQNRPLAFGQAAPQKALAETVQVAEEAEPEALTPSDDEHAGILNLLDEEIETVNQEKWLTPAQRAHARQQAKAATYLWWLHPKNMVEQLFSPKSVNNP
jgi:hypothetical protein